MNWKALARGAASLGAVASAATGHPTLGWVLAITTLGRNLVLTTGVVVLATRVERDQRKDVVTKLVKCLIKILTGR